MASVSVGVGAPCKAAAPLKILGVSRVIWVGLSSDLYVAFDPGLGDAVQGQHAAFALVLAHILAQEVKPRFDVGVVFCSESSRPRSARKATTVGLTTSSSISFVRAVTMKSSA